MKTAISVPDRIFATAERIIRRLGITRSEFYVNAVKVHIDKHRNDAVTRKLNEIYGQVDSSLDPSLQSIQTRSLGKKEW